MVSLCCYLYMYNNVRETIPSSKKKWIEWKKAQNLFHSLFSFFFSFHFFGNLLFSSLPYNTMVFLSLFSVLFCLYFTLFTWFDFVCVYIMFLYFFLLKTSVFERPCLLLLQFGSTVYYHEIHFFFRFSFFFRLYSLPCLCLLYIQFQNGFFDSFSFTLTSNSSSSISSQL